MKLIFTTLLFCASATALAISSNITTHATNMVAITLSKIVVNQLSSAIKSGSLINSLSINAMQEPGGPLNITIPLKGLPEPIELLPLEFPLNIPEPFVMTGDVAICSPQVLGQSELTGSAGLIYEMATTKDATINLDIQLPTIHIDSNYFLNIATLFNGNVGSINGEGKLSAGFTGFFFKLMAKGGVPLTTGERLSLDALDVDLGFEDLYVNMEGGFVNGEPLDLSELAATLKSLFNLLWKDPAKAQINEVIRCSIDHLINDCQPMDVIGGAFGCLKPELNPDCFTVPSALSALHVNNFVSYKPRSYCNPTQETSETPISSSSVQTSPEGSTPESTTAGAGFITSTIGPICVTILIICHAMLKTC